MQKVIYKDLNFNWKKKQQNTIDDNSGNKLLPSNEAILNHTPLFYLFPFLSSEAQYSKHALTSTSICCLISIKILAKTWCCNLEKKKLP